MLYPAYVHIGDDQHAHGVTFPDFPGCCSAADTCINDGGSPTRANLGTGLSPYQHIATRVGCTRVANGKGRLSGHCPDT